MTEYTRASAKILLEAADLQERKGQDYNGVNTSVKQADYYPRGVWSIMDIINAKYLRLVSVLEQIEQGNTPNFESVEDSAIDMINYASFLTAYMRGKVPGQNPNHNIFNKPINKPNPEPIKVWADETEVMSTKVWVDSEGWTE